MSFYDVMTLNIDIYCREKPDLRGLAKELDWRSEISSLSWTKSYRWRPTSDVVRISFDTRSPLHYSSFYEKDDITDIFVQARKDGIDIPTELTDKVKDDSWCVKADEKLYSLLLKYPHLEGGLPLFKNEWVIVRFSEGQPLYFVDLESTVFVSKKTISVMSALSARIAENYHGLIYEDQIDKFGVPDAGQLRELMVGAAWSLGSSVREMGFEFKPKED